MNSHIRTLVALPTLILAASLVFLLSGRARPDASRVGSAALSTPSLVLPGLPARVLLPPLTSRERAQLLALLNEAPLEELALIRGVGEANAAAIAEARPYRSIDEVFLFAGIREHTFTRILLDGQWMDR